MDKKEVEKKNNGNNKNLSLYPLKFDEAVKDLLSVKVGGKTSKIVMAKESEK